MPLKSPIQLRYTYLNDRGSEVVHMVDLHALEGCVRAKVNIMEKFDIHILTKRELIKNGQVIHTDTYEYKSRTSS